MAKAKLQEQPTKCLKNFIRIICNDRYRKYLLNDAVDENETPYILDKWLKVNIFHEKRCKIYNDPGYVIKSNKISCEYIEVVGSNKTFINFSITTDATI